MNSETETMLDELVPRMHHDLIHYPIETYKKKIKRLLRSLIRLQYIEKPDHFFWPNAMIAQALAESLTYYPEEGTQEVLESYVNQWIQKNKRIAYVDQIMNGYAICELYERKPEEKYLGILQQMKKYLLNCERAKDGSLLYRANQKERVYADTIGMVCPFLCRYAVMSGNRELTKLAVRQFTNFREYGYDSKSGLPYHSYHAETGEKLGIIGWGRAVGWILVGMADSEPYLQGQELDMVRKMAYELVCSAMKYQRPDGFFSWQLQAMEGPRDISATSMILGAVQKLVEEQKIDDEFYCYVEKGKDAILHTPDALNCCLSECEGLGSYPQYYAQYPWGDAATMRLLMKK